MENETVKHNECLQRRLDNIIERTKAQNQLLIKIIEDMNTENPALNKIINK